jgi:hypothetical protein
VKIRNPKSEIRRKSEGRNPKGLPAHDRHSGFGFRISGFLRISDFGLRIWLRALLVLAAQLSFGAATNSPAPDDIPPLRPAHGEMPPTFWEQHGLWVVLGGVALLALAGAGVWLLVRPKPPVAVAPEEQARRALEPLREKPEDGALLSRVSQVLRHYVTTAFNLPPEELTTAEFRRAIAGQDQIGPELSAALGEFLRQCDQRKFSPPAKPEPPLGAVAQALKLIEQAQARCASLAPSGDHPTPGAVSGPPQAAIER